MAKKEKYNSQTNKRHLEEPTARTAMDRDGGRSLLWMECAGRGRLCEEWVREGVAGGGNSMGKGPEVVKSLICSGNREETSVTGHLRKKG